MKRSYLFIIFSLLFIALVAKADDYLLLPENFFHHKGETLSLHLLYASMFETPKPCRYQPQQITSFVLYEGGKKTDLPTVTKDSAGQVLTYKLNEGGTTLATMTRNYVTNEVDRTTYIRSLDEEGLTKMSEKANNSRINTFKEKSTAYLKTLFTVDKASGNLCNKETGQQLEITLNQNPYKLSYGDDVTGIIKYKGKPLANAHIDLLVKTATGKIYPQKLNSEAKGDFFFKLSREGIYLLRMAYVEPSKLKDFDFEKWETSYTFAFSNSGTLPNTYREFGLGDKH